MQLFGCQYSEQYIFERNYEIKVGIFERKYKLPDLNHKDGPFHLLFSFVKCIGDLGVRFGLFLLGLCNLNLV